MSRPRSPHRLLTAAVLALPAALLPAAASWAAPNLEATFTKTSDWGTGFVANYTITNTGTSPADEWALEFDLAASQQITNVWNGAHTADGTHHTIVHETWTVPIDPGESVTIGLDGTYSGDWQDPTNCTINGASCDGGEPPPDDPPDVPAGLHVTGTTATSVSVAWDASAGATGYEVYVDGQLRAEPTTTAATVGGLSPDTAYQVTVAARNDAGASAQSAPVTAETRAGGGGGPGDDRLVGYFTQWGIYGRDFMVNDLHLSGAADHLTHINYAFGNVSSDSECFIVNQTGVGDAWADYQRGFTAGESVDGVADDWDQELKGNFNQLRKLKDLHPGLKAHISLGGWTWSTHFSDAALPENREAFVESCIDLYLRGNLPVQGGEPAGGPGSGFGVFDGIDIDWEWPGSEGQPGNTVRPEDRENLTALLQEFRTQLDALEAETGREYALTMFLPADPAKIEAGIEVDEVFPLLDFATVQGYDFHGAWESTTNHQSNLHNTPGDPSPVQFSVDTAIQEYLSRGAPAEKLVVGVPYYGRGWTGVPDGGTDGLFQPASGAAPGTWEQGVEDYKVLADRPGQRFRDTATGALWLHDGSEWWSYDDPQLLAQKAGYVNDLGLGGAMMWSLDGDDSQASLTSALADALD